MSASQIEAARIRGYADRQSVKPGERIGFCLSDMNGGGVAKCPLRVMRLGLRESEILCDIADVAAQPVPVRGWLDNGWSVSYALEIGREWKPGIYALRAGRGGDDTKDVFFIVRSSRAPGIIVQLPTTTINAYNNWGGAGLYGYNSPAGAAQIVSFNRPQQSDDAWKRGFGFAEEWNQRIKPFVRWMEAAGYDADYISGTDLHDDQDLLKPYRLFVSIGHDEYWSREMRERFDAFVARGGNAAIFGGNTCYWQIRLERDGRDIRQICYRDVEKDPVIDAKRKTLTWRDLGEPENTSFGAGFAKGAWKGNGSPGAFEVHRPEHWVFEGTGLQASDRFGEETLVYETNGADYARDAHGYPVITGTDGTPANYEILALTELPDWGTPGNAAMGLFTRGGTVFNAATTDWARGLEGSLAKGSHLQTTCAKITRNVIARLSNRTG